METVNEGRQIGRKLIVTGLVIGAVGVAAGFGTWAAFTSTTSNSGSSFTAGTVTITDDDSGSAAFTVSNMKPGDVTAKCIAVTNSGSLTFSNVALSATVGGTGLAAELDVDIDRGTGGSFAGGCGSFTQVTPNIYAGTMDAIGTINDATGWTPSATKTYRVDVSLPSDAPNTAQGDTATLTLNWDATS